MQRFFGAAAVFCGWLSIPTGAAAGLLVSQFFGIGHVEGANPPVDVYFISGIVVFWVYASATIVTALPLLLATVAPDPRRPLQRMAVVMWIAGASMLASWLGLAFGLPVLVGGVCLWYGAELIHRDAVATGLAAPDPVVVATAGDAAAFDPGAALDGARLAAGGSYPGFEATGEIEDVAAEAGVVPPPVAAVSVAAAEASTDANTRVGRRRARQRRAAGGRLCPWCSTTVVVEDGACPNCGATLDSPASDEVTIPGLTEVPASLRKYADDARHGRRRQSLLKMIFSETPIPTAIDGPAPSDASALRPPSAAVKAEMARMDYELAVAQMDLGAGAEPAQPPEGEYAAPEPAADDAPQAESATEAAETDVEPAPVPDQAGSEPDPRA